MDKSLPEKWNLICLGIIAAILTTATLIYMRNVLLPLVISIFIVMVMASPIQFLQHKVKLPRWFAITIGVFGVGVLAAIFWIIIYFSIKSFAEGAGIYQQRTIEIFLRITDWLSLQGIAVEKESLRDMFKNLPVFTLLKEVTKSMAGLLGDSLIVAVIVLFLLAGMNFQTPSNSQSVRALVTARVRAYVGAKSVSSLGTATLVGGVFLFADLELALMFAILTFFFNFIPNIGSAIAVVLPLPIAFLQFGWSPNFAIILVIPLAVHIIIGNVIEPKIMGESTGLHPVTLIIALLFWGKVWGVAGMFLAVPITAVIQILCQKLALLNPIANIMAGRLE